MIHTDELFVDVTRMLDTNKGVKMEHMIWLTDLTTDESELYNLAELGAAIDELVASGVARHDIGLHLDMDEEPSEAEATK